MLGSFILELRRDVHTATLKIYDSGSAQRQQNWQRTLTYVQELHHVMCSGFLNVDGTTTSIKLPTFTPFITPAHFVANYQ